MSPDSKTGIDKMKKRGPRLESEKSKRTQITMLVLKKHQHNNLLAISRSEKIQKDSITSEQRLIFRRSQRLHLQTQLADALRWDAKMSREAATPDEELAIQRARRINDETKHELRLKLMAGHSTASKDEELDLLRKINKQALELIAKRDERRRLISQRPQTTPARGLGKFSKSFLPPDRSQSNAAIPTLSYQQQHNDLATPRPHRRHTPGAHRHAPDDGNDDDVFLPTPRSIVPKASALDGDAIRPGSTSTRMPRCESARSGQKASDRQMSSSGARPRTDGSDGKPQTAARPQTVTSNGSAQRALTSENLRHHQQAHPSVMKQPQDGAAGRPALRKQVSMPPVKQQSVPNRPAAGGRTRTVTIVDEHQPTESPAGVEGSDDDDDDDDSECRSGKKPDIAEALLEARKQEKPMERRLRLHRVWVERQNFDGRVRNFIGGLSASDRAQSDLQPTTAATVAPSATEAAAGGEDDGSGRPRHHPVNEDEFDLYAEMTRMRLEREPTRKPIFEVVVETPVEDTNTTMPVPSRSLTFSDIVW